jgi:LmbE family N-acetylglucosaminyl deacetylase
MPMKYPTINVRMAFRICGFAAVAWLSTALQGRCQPAVPASPAAIAQELRSFREMGSVLYVAAHPDDENTQLIAYLARGRDYRTAYLSLTRGDGGQNVLGPEFGEKLGVARTQELLAARRLDGGRQFFSRAMDFGFSKDYRETLRIWDREQVVADIVRVIRTFRPDVVVTRFSPVPSSTHGHHTASAVLAIEAFKLAGDPTAFPDQLDKLAPWQPKRILCNGRIGGGTNSPTVQMAISGNDPVLGISFGELAGRSRAMHKTQGFGNFGGGRGGGARSETFQLLGGDPPSNDIMDGIDTTWGRIPGGADIGQMADDVIAKFNSSDPPASVPALLALRAKLAALATTDPLVVEKRALLDRILQDCVGIEVATSIPAAEVVPGEKLKLHHTALVHSTVPVKWLGVRYPTINRKVTKSIELTANQPSSRDSVQTLPRNTPLTQPYWLREEPTPGMFKVDDASLIGTPENPPIFPVEQIFEIGGQELIVPDQPFEAASDSQETQIPRHLDVIPPASLRFASEVALFSPGGSHSVEVEVTANRSDLSGTLRLETPAGWTSAPEKQSFHLGAVGDRRSFKFDITAPAQLGTAKILASAEIGGVRYSNQRIVIHYQHIPFELLQPPASVKAVCLDLAIRGRKIGYLPGAGDSVGDDLAQMGYDVTTLTDTDLTPDGLRGLDAVVVGVRAYNVRTNLASHLPALFDYVNAGGTVVAQYNRPDNNRSFQIAPYDLQLSQDRVTDETAPVTFLAPDHPVLNTPNKITSADFDGWIQERGIYFPSAWDSHFTPILAYSDPGEEPLKGSLLVAPYGKGYFVYTGIVFFRQLPAGVPGAYRLFANLVSLGK